MYARYFINQPSTSQLLHEHHGQVVVAADRDMTDPHQVVDVVVLDSTAPLISMRLPKAVLSKL